MTVEENEDTVRRLVEECVNANRPEALDRYVAADVRVHPGTPGAAPGTVGIAALEQAFRGFHQVFPDLSITLDDLVAADDRVAVRWTARGTHSAALAGVAATGTAVRWGGMDLYRLVDGRIVDWWRNDDVLELLKQLGRDVLDVS